MLGQDASEGFHEVGHSAEAMEQLKELKVGELDTTPVVRLKEMKVSNLRTFSLTRSQQVTTKPSQKASVSVAQLFSAAGVVALSLGAVFLRHHVQNPFSQAKE